MTGTYYTRIRIDYQNELANPDIPRCIRLGIRLEGLGKSLLVITLFLDRID